MIGLQVGGEVDRGHGLHRERRHRRRPPAKIGGELRWDYDWDEPLQPWHVDDPGGQLDMVLTPRYDKHTLLEGRKRGSEVHQVFGTWSGRLVTDDGLALEFTDLQGFAEEARQRW